MTEKKQESSADAETNVERRHKAKAVVPEGNRDTPVAIPRSLPVLAVRDLVVYPGMMVPLIISREQSVKLVDDVVVRDKLLALVAQKNPETEKPGPEDLYRLGTIGLVLKMLKFPDATIRILVQGLNRIQVRDFVQEDPYLVARIDEVTEIRDTSREVDAIDRHVTAQFQSFIEHHPQTPQELQVILMNIDDPGRRADIIASNLNITLAEKQQVLECLNVLERLHLVARLLSRELDLAELGSKLQKEVQEKVGKTQRDYFLREQLKAIRKELGEDNEVEMEMRELREKLEKANPPAEVRTEAERELERLAKMPTGSAEQTVSRTYLDWIISLPWSVSTEDTTDIQAAEAVLNSDHSGLDKVKERILEYLAVLQLKKDMKGPILCFVGPPGVGKTSLGRSIARSLGRRFVRISLGGVRDEAEIRGHRRTYIGALPGRVIQGIRKAGSCNPVFMLDEIDKLGSDFRGDPSSALLEVLDPEQNASFSDHYLEVPFDLSKVMFITTANVLETIPPPLRDRMEVLRLPGYTAEEKRVIARQFLFPKQEREHGLSAGHLRLDNSALRRLIQDYTREAGVRNLEREIATICRKIAKKTAYGEKGPFTVRAGDIPSFLGPQKFYQEIAERRAEPGVVTGLAWTESGGDILFIESTKMPGKKGFKLTGQLGEVMKESAEAALSCVRSRSNVFQIPADFFETYDLHLHVPAGSIPKDGPSAGVAMTLSLLSLATNRPVRPDIAMTGEITLRGKVLPVGGVKEKGLAAYRAGIRTILIPARNRNDLVDIAPEIRKRLDIRFVDTIQEAIDIALPGLIPKGTRRRKPRAPEEKG